MVKKLKVLNFTWCRVLTKTIDFSEFSNLEKLIFTWCVMFMVDSPIDKLKLLSKLNIEGGISLQVLYEIISSLVYLLELIVCSTDVQAS